MRSITSRSLAWPVLAGLGALTLLALLLAGTQLARSARQSDVALRGAAVMPFNLERTTHHFDPFPDGGRQQVVADDPADHEQIALIREHLQQEEAAFRRGDFGDPAAIHGGGMSGLAALETSAGKIAIAYSELPDGAQIRFTTPDTRLIDALHQWFAAQQSDHGSHVEEPKKR